MAALAHSRELTNIPSPARPGVENPEEPFPATKEQVERLIAQKTEERARICATLDREIETMKRSLKGIKTVNPVAHAVDKTSEIQLLREHFERRKNDKAAEERARETPAEKRARESAAWHASYYGGRRTRRKSQSRKKLSKTRRKRKNRKTKKRRRKSCKRCKKKRRE